MLLFFTWAHNKHINVEIQLGPLKVETANL